MEEWKMRQSHVCMTIVFIALGIFFPVLAG